MLMRRLFATKAEFALRPFETHLLKAGPNTTAIGTRDEVIKYFTEMTVIRRMETSCDTLYKSKFIRGFLHLYDGQESVCVGMEASLTREDCYITAYRCHGNQYLREGSVKKIIAELMGREGGSSRGKGGSMHLYDVPNNFFGGNGIVGAQVPVGAGLALGLKYNKKPNCAVAAYGDGASNQGQIAEAMNMAMLWKLPVVFVCENNKYGMGTSIERSSQNTAFYQRGDRVPGIKVDGTDVFAVREAMKFAKDHCVSGKGPIILEMETYRFHGHSMSDPGTSYRTKDEVAQMRASRDPIEKLRESAIDKKLVTPDELKAIEKRVRQEVEDAITWAKEQPEPAITELKTFIVKRDNEVPRARGVDIKNDTL